MIGLLSPDQAIAWADSQIQSEDAPSSEIIDVSWSKGLMSTVDALAAVQGDRCKPTAGRWLLGLLRQNMPADAADLQLAAQRAMQIARHADLGDETYYRFDMIDDELSLARTQIYGTVEECRANLLAELAEYKPLEVGCHG